MNREEQIAELRQLAREERREEVRRRHLDICEALDRIGSSLERIADAVDRRCYDQREPFDPSLIEVPT